MTIGEITVQPIQSPLYVQLINEIIMYTAVFTPPIMRIYPVSVTSTITSAQVTVTGCSINLHLLL